MDESLNRFDRPWIDVARIYRRVCFLRLDGREADSARMERAEFADAVAAARLGVPSGTDLERALSQLMREEEERVANAVAFAEVVVPRLSERTPQAGAARAAPDARRGDRQAPRAAGGTIADFIDDMLVQERPSSR